MNTIKTAITATVSLGMQEVALLLQRASLYTTSTALQEKLKLTRDTQSLIREYLEDDHYYSLQNILNLTPRELGKVLRAVSHITGMQVDRIAFVNEFDSDGQAYAMAHLDVTINLKSRKAYSTETPVDKDKDAV